MDKLNFNIEFEKHRNHVFKYILNIVKDNDVAEDLCQNTFLKAFTTINKGGYIEESKIIQWLMRIAHNQAIDYFRKVQRESQYKKTGINFNIFDTISYSDPNIEDNIITIEIANKLDLLINKLPKTQQDVVRLRFFENKSFNEIALETNVGINTSLGQMRYALKNLRKYNN